MGNMSGVVVRGVDGSVRSAKPAESQDKYADRPRKEINGRVYIMTADGKKIDARIKGQRDVETNDPSAVDNGSPKYVLDPKTGVERPDLRSKFFRNAFKGMSPLEIEIACAMTLLSRYGYTVTPPEGTAEQAPEVTEENAAE